MRREWLCLGLAAVAALSIAQAHEKDTTKPVDEALSKAIERYDIALMYDLPKSPVFVPATDGIGALDWLSMTAAANDRVLIEVEGTYILVRPDRPPGSPSQGDQAEVIGLLNRLSDIQLRAMLDGKLTLGDLAPADRAILLRNTMNWSGLHNFNPARKDVGEVLALHGRAGLGSVVNLNLGAKYTVETPSGASDSTYDLQKMKMGDQAVVVPSQAAVQKEEPFERSKKGMPLDFGAGETMNVAELLRRANRELETRNRIDGRVLDDQVFISGGYDTQTFDAAIKTLMRLRQLDNAPAAEQTLEAIKSEFVDRLRAIATAEEFVEDETISLGDLRQHSPQIADAIARRTNNAQNVEVSLGFMLSIHAGPPINSTVSDFTVFF